MNTLENDLYIGGGWQPATDGTRFAVIDPATEAVLTLVADAGIQDGRAAAAAAAAALPAWRATSPRSRGELLRRAFESIHGARESLADLIVSENGKCRADALAEADYAAEFFRWYSEEAVRLPGNFRRAPSGQRNILEMSEPVGVALLLTPWNLPAAMIARKVAPALAAGCTVVLKPSQLTPLTALALAQLLSDVGLPKGVVNVITTTRDVDVVGDLIAAGPIRALSFTGSTHVGSALLGQASKRVLNCSMELGGNAPFIVFEDADVDAAVSGALVAKMRHNAEACVAANRFYVHESVRSEFVTKLSIALGDLRIGPGSHPGVDVGPMASGAARDSLDAAVHAAVDDGGTVRLGGVPMTGQGFYFAPTLIDEVPPDAPILNHELFGPIAPIVSFTDDAEAITFANQSEMGLGSYVYSASLSRALHAADGLDVGMVGINTGILSDPAAPFGGTKQSGIGREGGRHGITEFLETKYVSVDW